MIMIATEIAALYIVGVRVTCDTITTMIMINAPIVTTSTGEVTTLSNLHLARHRQKPEPLELLSHRSH